MTKLLYLKIVCLQECAHGGRHPVPRGTNAVQRLGKDKLVDYSNRSTSVSPWDAAQGFPVEVRDSAIKGLRTMTSVTEIRYTEFWTAPSLPDGDPESVLVAITDQSVITVRFGTSYAGSQGEARLSFDSEPLRASGLELVLPEDGDKDLIEPATTGALLVNRPRDTSLNLGADPSVGAKKHARGELMDAAAAFQSAWNV